MHLWELWVLYFFVWYTLEEHSFYKTKSAVSCIVGYWETVEYAARVLLLVIFAGLAIAQINFNTNIPKRNREIPKTIVVLVFVHNGYRKGKNKKFYYCQKSLYDFISLNDCL